MHREPGGSAYITTLTHAEIQFSCFANDFLNCSGFAAGTWMNPRLSMFHWCFCKVAFSLFANNKMCKLRRAYGSSPSGTT